MELTIDLLQRAIENNAFITSIRAEDKAECERSVYYKFTPEQSKVIFEAALAALALKQL